MAVLSYRNLLVFSFSLSLKTTCTDKCTHISSEIQRKEGFIKVFANNYGHQMLLTNKCKLLISVHTCVLVCTCMYICVYVCIWLYICMLNYGNVKKMSFKYGHVHMFTKSGIIVLNIKLLDSGLSVFCCC